MNILLVDDEPMVLESLERILTARPGHHRHNPDPDRCGRGARSLKRSRLTSRVAVVEPDGRQPRGVKLVAASTRGRETRVVALVRASLTAALFALADCGGGGDSPPPLDGAATPPDAADGDGGPPVQHLARFVGLWAVEQPTHALYEVTYYRLDVDGAVTIGPSDPADCSGHLARHCVTGSVARCVPSPPESSCQGTPTCVFGDRWHSRGDRVVIFDGVCDDHVAREIAIEVAADPSHDAEWGGAGGTLLTVGGDPAWAHDSWPWAFRKCPAGTTPATCHP